MICVSGLPFELDTAAFIVVFPPLVSFSLRWLHLLGIIFVFFFSFYTCVFYVSLHVFSISTHVSCGMRHALSFILGQELCYLRLFACLFYQSTVCSLDLLSDGCIRLWWSWWWTGRGSLMLCCFVVRSPSLFSSSFYYSHLRRKRNL